jgi:hypothetical protein
MKKALNHLELAKAYNQNEQKSKAIAILKRFHPSSIELWTNTRIKKEGAVLLKELMN